MHLLNCYVYLVLVILVVLGGVFYLRYEKSGDLKLNGHDIKVERATNEAQQQRGLSGRLSLDNGHGMLFVHSEDGQHQIWMKDMKFKIDVLWLDKDGRVVYMVDNMDPSSYPNSFQSDEPARYVLELNETAIERYAVKEGDLLEGI